MTERQKAIAAASVLLVIVLGIGIGLLVGSGGDDEVSSRPERSSSSSSSSTTTTTAPTTTTVPLPMASTAPTTPPPSIVINSPTTPPTQPPTQPPTPPTQPPTQPTTTSTEAPTTTSTEAPTTTSTEAPTTTSTEPDDRDIGITATQIRLAVIADGPAAFDGMKAWQRAVNGNGGIADRKIKLDLLATGDTPEGFADAVATACRRDFAIVGTRSGVDGDAGKLDCGIPDLPTQVTDPQHGDASTTFAVIPRRPGVERVGAFKQLVADVEGCCAQFALVPATDPGRTATLASVAAATQIGFAEAGTADLPPDESTADYPAIVEQIVESDATFARAPGAASLTELRKEAQTQRLESVDAWYCDESCGNPGFSASDPEALEGQYVDVGLAPFVDGDAVPGLRSYLREADERGDAATVTGLQAYAAGLLFEESAKQVVTQDGKDGLRRTRLLDVLGGIRDFTADGILGPTNIADREPTGCFALLQVRDGKLERSFPAQPGQLDCRPQNLETVAP